MARKGRTFVVVVVVNDSDGYVDVGRWADSWRR